MSPIEVMCQSITVDRLLPCKWLLVCNKADAIPCNCLQSDLSSWSLLTHGHFCLVGGCPSIDGRGTPPVAGVLPEVRSQIALIHPVETYTDHFFPETEGLLSLPRCGKALLQNPKCTLFHLDFETCAAAHVASLLRGHCSRK